MADFELERVIELADEAGKLARSYFGKVSVQRKSDSSLVTEADHAVEKLVRRRLAEITPEWPVLGEEEGRGGVEIDRSEPFWVVDPVDGTSSFIYGLPCWCFSLGLIVGDRAEFGVIELPMSGETFYTDTDGKKVYLNGIECPPAQPLELDKQSVLYVPSNSHRRYLIDFPGKQRSLGSAAYHGILAGRGRTAGALHGQTYLWDMAAALAIVGAWGVRVGDLSGREIGPRDWELQGRNPGQLLFAHPEHFDFVAGTIELK
jgi:fructose-1,6-bisphosphatase/inositol monophosphatase family enzyme